MRCMPGDLVAVPQPFPEAELKNVRATLGPRYARGILTSDPETYPGFPRTYGGFTDAIKTPVLVGSAPTIPEFHAGLPPSMQEYGR